MDFERRRERALALLAQTRLGRNNAAPPLYRLLWRLGVRVPPPHFAPFGLTAAVSGVFFGVLWGATMWLAVWSRKGYAPATGLLGALAAGLLFGLTMAWIVRRQARALGLPAWREIA